VEVRGDFLVIGSGIAGLRAAVSLARVGDVVILTKANHQNSNTGYAQGGIAAALGPGDSLALHARDTVEAGDGLCDVEAVDVLVDEGKRYVRELIDWGARFDRDVDGTLVFGIEAAHSVRRVLHARDATGREIGRLLWSRVNENPRVHVVDGTAVALVIHDGSCVGATFISSKGREGTVVANSTLLATGGASYVYRETTNPPIATGDGLALAMVAGARISGMEFVQYHPTVLNVKGHPRFLLSEALRGEGALLVNAAGEPFMKRYEIAGELASRDVVSRALVTEAARTGAPIYLTLAHLNSGFVRSRFPTITSVCADAGLDLATDRVPVSPAAHYIMGGVETDTDGRTSVAGLCAAGEVAFTRVHGANRVASNSLLEGLVFGVRAAGAMNNPWTAPRLSESEIVEWDPPSPLSGEIPTVDEVRDLMWERVGLMRDRQGLTTAVDRLQGWAGALVAVEHTIPTVINSLVTAGLLIARSALRREESRGAHFRTDFPARDDLHWRRHVADCLRAPTEIP
jgi:L-aspartate oxidase